MKYIGRYYCNYAGCEEVYGIIANSKSDAEDWMQAGLCDYVMSVEHLAMTDYDEDELDEWEASQDYEDFCSECDYIVEEATDEMIEDYGLDDNPEEWEDIRNIHFNKN